MIALIAAATVSCRTAPPAATSLGRDGLVVCSPSADRDQDGLSDACELELARAFAPVLRIAPRGCNWDSSVEPPRPGGGYYFGAQEIGDAIRLVYLPAYYRDCGWSGFKCTIGLMSCAGHAGDSEVIVIDVTSSRGPSQYTPRAVFLSAHCFGRSTANCRWYERAELDRFEWRGSHALIWVAEGKQANYPDRSACDRGHWFYDTCDGNDAVLEFPIVSDRQNIGSRRQPVAGSGCVDAQHAGWVSRLTDAQAQECLWSADRPFTGWQRPTVGSSTPYERYLSEIARF